MTSPLTFYNSASHTKELFTPLDPQHIRMYVCGPTVYDHIHIGNARPIVVFDVLFRLLTAAYPNSKITYASNITDIDDKIIARSQEINVPISELTQTTTKNFIDCCKQLGTLPPTVQPKATEYVSEMIGLIAELIRNERAYDAGDGHVLCEVGKDPLYGSLSSRNQEEQIAGARVEIAPYKRNPADFVLWKPSSKNEPGWKSPWGFGRPGWHTECVAMSSHLLGHNFDIHGGGIDLIFPHHENELCQCRGLSTDNRFASYWLHNGYVVVDDKKMSKSLNNFVYAKDLISKHGGNVVRIALLMTHYRKPLNMNEDRIREAVAIERRIRKAMHVIPPDFHASLSSSQPPSLPSSQAIALALADDLDTYSALNLLNRLAYKVLHPPSKKPSEELFSSLISGAKLLGIDCKLPSADTQKIKELLHKRSLARRERDFKKADTLRLEIEQTYNVTILDHPNKESSWIPQ